MLQSNLAQAVPPHLDLDALFDQGFVDEASQQALHMAGFHAFQTEDSDYTDFECVTQYAPATQNSDFKSLNLHLSFDWGNRAVYQTIGVNLGDGFERELSVDDNGGRFEEQLRSEIVANLGTASQPFCLAIASVTALCEIMNASRNLSFLFRR